MDRRVAVPILLVIVAATTLGCNRSSGKDDESTEPLPWQTGGSASEEVELTPDDQAIAAVEAYWRAFDEATQVPDPAYENLSVVASGQALESAQDVARDTLDKGWRQEGSTVLSDLVVLERTPEDDPTSILVELCMDTTPTLIVDADTGQPIPDEEYGRRSSRAQVIAGADGWVVDVVNVEEIGSC
jgi:hypothetical protein